MAERVSRERDLLKKILATGWLNNTISCEVEGLLTEPEPEPFSPDWANYRQGIADATCEPLSDDAIWQVLASEQIPDYKAMTFIRGVKWAEQQHGIGVDDE